MRTLEILLNHRWVVKSENKELYYQLRDEMGEVRKFVTEKMGCQIIENSLLVKMEKIPSRPEEFMGIQGFTSRKEYAMLCILLMFLEDKEPEEQFVLSQLTEYIAANIPGLSVDWTLYGDRRRLIKVLRYSVGQGMIRVTDGSDDYFMDDRAGEVLYENTGASRYFMKNFVKDITAYGKPEDFSENEWFDMDTDRGIVRRHRVYKRLLFSVGMYKEQGQEEDFEYLKNYGRRLGEELEQIFDCRLHIHKTSAYLTLGENCHMGECFPGNNMISDILLLCFAEIRRQVKTGIHKEAMDESLEIDRISFERMLRQVKGRFASGFTKAFREMTEGEFASAVIEEMIRWSFIEWRDEKRTIKINPSVGKIQAHYPEDFQRILDKKESEKANE